VRPHRTVTQDGAEYVVDGFRTTDAILASAVRQELDRRDPLPCDEHEPVDVTSLGSPTPRHICAWCSEEVEYG